jgi:phosphate-selective porin OprO/OprP
MKNSILTASAISLVLLSGTAFAADSTDARIKKLEAEIALIKRQQEVAEEKTTTVSEKNANVEIGKKGLIIASPDKKYQFEVHGIFQLDSRDFVNDDNSTGRNDLLVRRARPIFNFKAGNTSLYFMPDFAGSSTKIFDAYAEHKFSDAVKVRFGKFKTPIGLEELQSDPDTFFTERGLVADLQPARDEGLQVSGSIIPDVLDYQVGIFNGNADLANTDNDADDKKDFAGRIFAKPFHNSDIVPLQGFGIGIGGSTGDREGSATNSILPTGYVTPSQQTFFSYTTGTYASGQIWRLSPQAYWYSGNKGILAEYAVTNQEVKRATFSGDLEHKAWQVAGSYVLTGEDVNYSGGVKPANEFKPGEGSWGAFELVARVGQIELDDATFPTFASTASSAKKATSYGVGANWYWNENVKLAVNYNLTQFDAGNINSTDRPDENAILGRVQVRF